MPINSRLFLLYLISFFLVACIEPTYQPVPKINGVCLVNPSQPVEALRMNEVKRVGAEWVALVPYAFSRANEPAVHFDNVRQWWGERSEGTRILVSQAKESGLQVMLKPHVWMGRGWIGDFDLDTEEKWKEWELSYKKYILNYARLAEELDVPLFCIGTELKIAVVKRPEFWHSLIQKVREVYHGKLTYAANWDNYENIAFWKDLDYIGIDAYYPLVHEANPISEELLAAWVPIRSKMKKVSQDEGRPILFTEFGYQSVNGSAGNHWEVDKSDASLNMDIQNLGYEALFQTFWKEDWFAGGFLWKWHLKEDAGGTKNPHFTPQNKPVEQVILKWYGAD